MGLKELRARRAWSQEDLALEAGVSRWAVKQLEAGTSRPQAETLRKLAAALGIEPAELARHLVEGEGRTDPGADEDSS